MSRPLPASGPSPGRGKREEKAIRRQRFPYLAKENAALQLPALSMEPHPQRLSVGTMICRRILRMCLRSHLPVTIGLVHSRLECSEPSAAGQRTSTAYRFEAGTDRPIRLQTTTANL